MDDKVRQFIDDTTISAPEKAAVLKQIRNLVVKTLPDAEEKIMYGGIVFKRKSLLCGLFIRKNHITIEFEEGSSLQDPYKVLEGTGKGRRHIKIFNTGDIIEKNIAYYINQKKLDA